MIRPPATKKRNPPPTEVTPRIGQTNSCRVFVPKTLCHTCSDWHRVRCILECSVSAHPCPNPQCEQLIFGPKQPEDAKKRLQECFGVDLGVQSQAKPSRCVFSARGPEQDIQNGRVLLCTCLFSKRLFRCGATSSG